VELEGNNIFLQSSETDKNYNKKILKLRDRSSRYIGRLESYTEDFHQGIMLDIFEVIVYSNKISRYYKLLKRISFIKKKSNGNLMKKIGVMVLNVLKINKISEKILKSYRLDETLDYKNTFLTNNEDVIDKVDTRYVLPLSKIDFEGYLFPCPGNRNKYLESIYGKNYMEFPPKERRVLHAKYINVDESCHYQKKLDKENKK
ncbi:MAG: LicD family protein, partial [Psychrilyobacter sp.]|uniref:LicD family protein n=1 Tax=Psychrilyobacter sp. TaxID=2586924 RepID=UPI003C7149DB